MFESATLKLTGWYLLILTVISLTFSAVIFQISTSEISTRLGVFETRLETQMPLYTLPMPLRNFRANQLRETETHLFFGLLYTNVIIVVFGGVGSFLLARRTLRPIEIAHEAQSRFTSDASHELRTPLAVMKSELEVGLRSKTLSKNDMHELLESNLEEVNRLAKLSETLLQLSKNDSTNLEMKPIDLRQLVEKAVQVQSVPAKRISLDGAKRAPMHGNESSVLELIMILLDNALRYSPEKSTVSIKLSAKEDVRCVITNHGEAIKPDDLPHVFERFYRAEKSRTSRHTPGYGLGLSLAKKIVDVHRGSIEITSTAGGITSVATTFKKA